MRPVPSRESVPTRWALITGEYPPQEGGVADFTRILARALVAEGDEVHVLAPPCRGPEALDPGVTVHRLQDAFSRRGRTLLSARLQALCPSRLLVQYVPHAFGARSMNLGFAAWLSDRRHGPLWIVFHEVASPLLLGWSPVAPLRALVHRRMARLAGATAERIFVSTESWTPLLRRLLPRSAPAPEWLPIPSTIPTETAPAAVGAVRARFCGPAGAALVGTFGTFGALVTEVLEPAAVALLQKDPGVHLLLVGDGGEQFRSRLCGRAPDAASRIHATGRVPPDSVAAHIAACDLLLQIYLDGASARRTSLMAALALGRPVITTDGHLTEAFWRESGAVMLVPARRSAAAATTAESLLRDREKLRKLGARATAFYAEHLSMRSMVERLRASPRQSAGVPRE